MGSKPDPVAAVLPVWTVTFYATDPNQKRVIRVVSRHQIVAANADTAYEWAKRYQRMFAASDSYSVEASP